MIVDQPSRLPQAPTNASLLGLEQVTAFPGISKALRLLAYFET